MTKFVFRTCAGKNIGIGHLMRCLHLAREIEAQGGQSLFVLDYLSDDLRPFLPGQDFVCLYDTVQEHIDPQKDAALFLEHTEDADGVILDDYRINQDWEEIITARQEGYKLCVLDDIQRPHTCDVIISMGSHGEQNLKDWSDRVPEHCQKLLGPSYSILSEFYQQKWRKRTKNDPFSIMISLGGSGDLQTCAGITDALLDAFDQPININILIGPLSQGQGDFKARYRDIENVNCLTDVQEAYPVLQETDLYIGAAGTMLLQVRCLNIPALTFSLADNQKNNIFNLEDIGHYFHLNNWTYEDFPAFAAFARTVYDHYKRVLQMGVAPVKKIDGLGSKRIAACLCTDENIVPVDEAQSRSNDEAFERLSADYAIRPVKDQDINLYRHSRNLENNHKFMTLTQKIAAIGHYSWWFNNRRESFVLEKNGKASLIIWHQKVSFEGRDFMNAGWFICDEKSADFKDVLIAMNWQVKYCGKHHTSIPWLSVLKKDNRFAKQINDYFGFEEMDENHPYYHVCSEMFTFATKKDFHYIVFEMAAKRNKVK